jgi:hypothetical protein
MAAPIIPNVGSSKKLNIHFNTNPTERMNAGMITLPKPCKMDVIDKIIDNQNICTQNTMRVVDKSRVSKSISFTGGSTKTRPVVEATPNINAIRKVSCAYGIAFRPAFF